MEGKPSVIEQYRRKRDILRHAEWNEIIYARRLNKGYSSKTFEGSQDRQTPDEDRRNAAVNNKLTTLIQLQIYKVGNCLY